MRLRGDCHTWRAIAAAPRGCVAVLSPGVPAAVPGGGTNRLSVVDSSYAVTVYYGRAHARAAQRADGWLGSETRTDCEHLAPTPIHRCRILHSLRFAATPYRSLQLCSRLRSCAVPWSLEEPRLVLMRPTRRRKQQAPCGCPAAQQRFTGRTPAGAHARARMSRHSVRERTAGSGASTVRVWAILY